MVVMFKSCEAVYSVYGLTSAFLLVENSNMLENHESGVYL